MLDDGQFGNVPILTQFNWANGYSEGGEFKVNYTQGNFNAYANFAYNISRATGRVESIIFLTPMNSPICRHIGTIPTTCSA